MEVPAPERGQDDGSASHEPTDHWLLERIHEGDQEAAAEMYLRYAHRLRGLAQARCSPALAQCLEAEDIVQSVFRSFFRRAQQGCYDVPSDGELWKLFMVITLNKIRQKGTYFFAGKRDRRAVLPGPSSEAALKMKGQDAGGFLQMVVNEALERLPAHHRQIVELRIQGYELEEIATKVNRAKRTVERVLQQFRMALESLLDETD